MEATLEANKSRIYVFKSDSGRTVSIISDNYGDARLEASRHFTFLVEGEKHIENFESLN